MQAIRCRWSWLGVLAVLLIAPAAWSQGNVVSCSSDDMGYHTCNIGPNRGVRLVRQHSDAQCVQGQTYGVRGEQVWVNRGCRADFEIISGRGGNWGGPGGGPATGNANIVTCASDDMRRHFCNIGGNSRVRLVRQRSDAACEEGRTWGVNGGQLWVDRGCRADFEVRQDSGRGWDNGHDHDNDHDRDNNYQTGPRTVTCASDDMHRHVCDVGPNNGIRLVRKRSDARCDMNRSYGISGNSVWVDRGCRADFEVIPAEGRHR